MICNPFDSRKLALTLLVAPAAILAPAPALHADAPDEDTYMGESPERYAQVKVVEGDVRIRKDEGEEALSRGIPIAEGDVVESRGRGVLQLGDGSRIGFASGTRFQVAALFTDKKGDRQVLLRLDYGRIRVALGAQSEARIRLDTPAGMATLVGDKGSATCEVEHDRTVRLRVHSGRVNFANDADRTTIAAGERITVYGSQDRLDRIRSFNTYDADSFDEWCEDHFVIRHRASWDRVPREIRYYSDDLDEHGEWIYVDETSSWCWRPTGVSAEWRPYWRGRWGAYAGGMTWISDEPWGYVTYHHGRWGWGAGLGWYWIPGVYYSPAWVAWNSYDSYFGWAPLGYWNAPCHWGYGAWGGGYCWNVVNVTYINATNIHTRIHTDVNVIGTFNRGTGTSTWTGTGNPGRPLTPGFQRGPLVITRAEFSNPTQFQRAVTQRPILQERLQTYERQAQTSTGRTILRREAPAPVSADRGGATVTQPGRDPRSAAFEDRSRPVPGRPIFRETRPVIATEAGARESRPVEPGRTPQEQPRQRTAEERPAPRSADRPASREIPRETPREAPRERDYRPREADRVAPRETPRDLPRERPRDSFREEAPRERPAPAPRETPRSEPSREVRQERPSAPAPSPSPAPASRPSAPDRSTDRPRSR